MQDLRFRPITPLDLPLINRLMREGKGYWGYDESGLDRFMKTFGISNESYFRKAFGSIAASCHSVVGYYLFKINENGLELDHFFLDTRFIGQGYARLLWEHCTQAAQAKGWSEFIFSSDPHALGFYERMGAIKIRERPMAIFPGFMTAIMRFSV